MKENKETRVKKKKNSVISIWTLRLGEDDDQGLGIH